MINIIVVLILIFSLKKISIILSRHAVIQFFISDSFKCHPRHTKICTHTHSYSLTEFIHQFHLRHSKCRTRNCFCFFFFPSNSFPGSTFALDVVPHFTPNIFDRHSASLVGSNNKCVYFVFPSIFIFYHNHNALVRYQLICTVYNNIIIINSIIFT